MFLVAKPGPRNDDFVIAYEHGVAKFDYPVGMGDRQVLYSTPGHRRQFLRCASQSFQSHHRIPMRVRHNAHPGTALHRFEPFANEGERYTGS